MRRHSISGTAFRTRMTDAIGCTPVLTIHGNRIVRTLLRVGVFAISVSVLLLLAASPARAFPFGPYVFTVFQSTDNSDPPSLAVPPAPSVSVVALPCSTVTGTV